MNTEITDKLIEDEENAIIDLIYFSDEDFSNQNISPNKIIEGCHLYTCEIVALLNVLRRGAEEIKIAFKNLGQVNDRNEAIKNYHAIGKTFAPIAFAIYDRLSKKDDEPRISTYLAVNRFKSTNCTPDAIIFWADPDAIRGLYESLEKDGYYAGTA